MAPSWFIPRRYKHFDVPVKPAFAEKVLDPALVARHSFVPLIFYEKHERRYRPKLKRVEVKVRPIMYASHRDACILSYYAWQLNCRLEAEYVSRKISESVIAYRALRKANYHFSAEALRFAKDHAPCKILAFDVRGFFDTLDHLLLKERLKSILGATELPIDWYAVYRHVTKFSFISRDDLLAHPVFGPWLKDRAARFLGTIDQVRTAGLKLNSNNRRVGIPQGTPISSSLANLYMMDFDERVATHCRAIDAFYRRYSDDLIFICREADAACLEEFVDREIGAEKLELNENKTERTLFDSSSTKVAQYLGFHLSHRGAVIRPSSLARQWRKLKYAVRRVRRVGEKAIAEGRASKIYTRKLRRRFGAMPVSVRNFSSYARRSAVVFGSPHIRRQVRRLERMLDEMIHDLT